MADLSHVVESGVWAAIKAGPTMAYAVLSVDPEDKKKVLLTASGRGDLQKMVRFLEADKIQFGVFRFFEIAAGGVKTPKYAFFTWSGPSAGIRTKTTAQNLKAPVKEHFDGHHVELEFNTSTDQFAVEEVIKRLNATRGAIKPQGYEFGTGTPGDLDDDELAVLAEQKRQEEEAARIKAEEEARIAAEEARIAAEKAAIEAERQRKLALLPARTKSAVKLVTTRVSGGLDFSTVVDVGAVEALADLDDATAWIVLSVPETDEKGTDKPVQIDGTGSGGLDEVISVLRDDDMQYGVVRVTVVERKGLKFSMRPRLVFFTWSGPGVTAKVRKYNTGFTGVFSSYFQGICADVALMGDKSALNEEALTEKLRPLHGGNTHAEFRFGYYAPEAQADDYIAQMDRVKELGEDAGAGLASPMKGLGSPSKGTAPPAGSE